MPEKSHLSILKVPGRVLHVDFVVEAQHILLLEKVCWGGVFFFGQEVLVRCLNFLLALSLSVLQQYL